MYNTVDLAELNSDELAYLKMCVSDFQKNLHEKRNLSEEDIVHCDYLSIVLMDLIDAGLNSILAQNKIDLEKLKKEKGMYITGVEEGEGEDLEEWKKSGNDFQEGDM